MFISITDNSIPRDNDLSRDRKKFESLFDSINLSYEYYGYTIPPNSMKKMNKWKIYGNDNSIGPLDLTGFICYFSE